MKLLIVESPAKAKKIAGFLGTGWRVEACRGHIRDLPHTALGVDVAQEFRPQYEVLPRKGNLVRRLVKAMQAADAVYLATDPDREGEAIAWHLLQLARLPAKKTVYRAAFSAITKDAVQAALDNPRSLDVALVEAQQTRRIVDRLVGYLVSPLACKALDGRLSAGRVQSVGLRLVVEREREIAAFVAHPYWTIALDVVADGQSFTAQLSRIRGANPHFSDKAQAEKLVTLLQSAQVWVSKAGQSTSTRKPLPPFTTSSLQQAAAKGLGFSPERTMQLAQTLYEAGLITYHRTDGVAVDEAAQRRANHFILEQYGVQYLPDTPHSYTAKSANAQEAHEAIRPTDLNHLPDVEKGDGSALYALIWQRFLASQMAVARYTVTGAILHAGQNRSKPFPLEFRAQGRELIFDGFLRVYEEPSDDDDEAEENASIPVLKQDQLLSVADVPLSEKQTRAPSRYTEASLVQALEQRGIGRPSTFASTLQTLKQRKYIKLSKKRLVPTALGESLNDFVVGHFPQVMAFDYTAQLETQLDGIASGDSTRLDTLQQFWKDFQPALSSATEATLATMKQGREAESKPLVLRPATED